MRREIVSYIVAAMAGILAWLIVSELSGRREAWDAPVYFTVALPCVAAVAGILGFFTPDGAWRWGLTPMVAQAGWAVLTNGAGNLLPLGLVVFALLAIPPIILAWLGAFVGRRV